MGAIFDEIIGCWGRWIAEGVRIIQKIRQEFQVLTSAGLVRMVAQVLFDSAGDVLMNVPPPPPSWDSLPDVMLCRRRSIRATCARPTIAMRCACSGVLTSSTVHRRHEPAPSRSDTIRFRAGSAKKTERLLVIASMVRDPGFRQCDQNTIRDTGDHDRNRLYFSNTDVK